MCRNTDVKGTAGEDSEGIEKNAIRNGKKRDPCYLVSGSLDELCPTVVWKAQLVSKKLEYLAEVISKQSIEVAAWILLVARSKLCEERDKLKE